MSALVLPMPAFGGKSRAAPLVWERFGEIVNYIEPCCRSAAVFFACPTWGTSLRVATLNDLDAHIANLLRSIQLQPNATAEAADHGVVEVDLHAWHRKLVAEIPTLRARLVADPKFCEPELAGRYIWGASTWMGSGWCEEANDGDDAPSEKLPILISGNAGPSPQLGKGVHAGTMRIPAERMPDLAGGTQWGTDEPNVRVGRGVHSESMRGPAEKLPELAGSSWKGKPGHNAGRGTHVRASRSRLYEIFGLISERLRHARVICGQWDRVCTPSVTWKHGLTGVFLDPPYPGFEAVYGKRPPIWQDVVTWAVKNGERKDLRAAVCGYEGTGEVLLAAGWEEVAWKSKGGYSNQRKGGNNGNKDKERIWFSPNCRRPGVNYGQLSIFGVDR